MNTDMITLGKLFDHVEANDRDVGFLVSRLGGVLTKLKGSTIPMNGIAGQLDGVEGSFASMERTLTKTSDKLADARALLNILETLLDVKPQPTPNTSGYIQSVPIRGFTN